MKIKNKVAITIIVSLVLFFVSMSWAFVPMTGPLVGIQRTQEELIEFAKRRHMVLFVDPATILKDRDNSYHDWASAETRMRIKVAGGLWLAGIIALGFWAAKRNSRKTIDNNQMQDICA